MLFFLFVLLKYLFLKPKADSVYLISMSSFLYLLLNAIISRRLIFYLVHIKIWYQNGEKILNLNTKVRRYVLEEFYFSKKDISNYYPERKILISHPNSKQL